jgi:hypothetical protein
LETWEWVKDGYCIRFVHPEINDVIVFKLKFGV